MRLLPLLLLSACIENGVSKIPDESAPPADDSAVPTPALRVSPTTLDFGSLPLGDQGSATFTVENAGGAPLTLSPLTLEGAAFSVVEALPGQLDPGDAATLTVVFTPVDTEPTEGTVTIRGDDPANPEDTVQLLGDAFAGRLTLDPAGWDFGELELGSSATASFLATNTGDGALSLDPLTLGGSADFRVVDAGGFDAPRSLGAGESGTITVAYAPGEAGPDSGVLALGGVEAALSGSGRPEPVCTAFDDFSTWSIGGTGNWTATGILTENRSGAYASIAYLPDQGRADHFALQVDTAWRGSLNDFAGLVFGVQNGDEYWVVRWDDPNGSYGRYSPTGAIDLSWCSYGACTQSLQVSSMDLGWPADGSFVTWSMDLDQGQLRVIWNGLTVVDQLVPELVGVGPGPVGLYSNDNDGGIVYDNFCVLVDP